MVYITVNNVGHYDLYGAGSSDNLTDAIREARLRGCGYYFRERLVRVIPRDVVLPYLRIQQRGEIDDVEVANMIAAYVYPIAAPIV